MKRLDDTMNIKIINQFHGRSQPNVKVQCLRSLDYSSFKDAMKCYREI